MVLGAISEKGQGQKANDSKEFPLYFEVLGSGWGFLGYFEDLGQVGLSWAILATSWELLGKMLGQRWPKLAQDGQLEWKK